MRPRERKAAAVPTGPSLAAQALRRQATHDTLTGLPNRALLNDRLRRALREATQKCTNAALLVMDLDQFKEIDDALGHHAGDQLLVGLSRRLEDMLGDSGLIARLGGDEFAIERRPRRCERMSALIAWPGTSRCRRRCTRPSRTSVDDFGTGHSALAYLEHLPIDEDDDTLQRLRSLGCDRAQGYHLSPPITCHDVPSAIAAAHTSVGRTAVARQ